MKTTKDGNLAQAPTPSVSLTEATPRMDPELKARWVDALRSGKYQQGKRELRNRAGFCCLGVLCDVIDPTDWHPFQGREAYAYGPNRKWAYLPPEVRELTGITSELDGQLAKFNDGYGDDGEHHEPMTFIEIADWIEENL